MIQELPKYTFLLTYKVIDRNYVVLKSGQMRCKNQVDERSAKRSLENMLKKKFPHAHKIQFLGNAVNETLEQQGDDVISLIKRHKAYLRKA